MDSKKYKVEGYLDLEGLNSLLENDYEFCMEAGCKRWYGLL